MRYLTVDYVCPVCNRSIRVRTAVPEGKEYHALHYAQAIFPTECLWCRQKEGIKNCDCSRCIPQTGTIVRLNINQNLSPEGVVE